MRSEQCHMCNKPATGMFRRIATDDVLVVCHEHADVLNRSVERSMREIEQITDDELEFADARRRRTLTPVQRAKFVEAMKRAAAAGKLKGPMRLTTAQLLLDAAINK
jgi:hypothetical protein